MTRNMNILYQKRSYAKMRRNPYLPFKLNPGGWNKGLFNQIKRRNAVAKIGTWFKRRFDPKRAVALNNARLKRELDQFKFSANHKASVRRHFMNYSAKGKTAPASKVSKMYEKQGWYSRPLYLMR